MRVDDVAGGQDLPDPTGRKHRTSPPAGPGLSLSARRTAATAAASSSPNPFPGGPKYTVSTGKDFPLLTSSQGRAVIARRVVECRPYHSRNGGSICVG